MARSRTRRLSRIFLGRTNKLRLTAYDSDAIVNSASKGAFVPSAGTEVVSALSGLDSDAVTGSQAFVSANSFFYIKNDDGWHQVLELNETRCWITEPTSTFSFDLGDGNNDSEIEIAIEAGDSDNPSQTITYTTTLDSDANQFLNLTKDSDNGRVFTASLKENTDSENDLTGTVTFKASDGVNFITSTSTFNVTAALGPTYFITPSANGTQWQNAALYRLDAYANHPGVSVASVSSYNSSNYTWTIDTDQFFDGTHVTPAFSGWTASQNYLLVVKMRDPDSGFNDRGACYIGEYTGSNTGDTYDSRVYYGSYGGSASQGNATNVTTIAAGNTSAFWMAYMRNAANTKAAWWYSANGTSWSELGRSSTSNITRIAVSANKRQTTSTNRTLQLLDASLYGSYISINH